MLKSITWGVVVLMVLIPFGYAYFLFPSLPDTIPIHFNAKGEADGWGSKHQIYLLPTILGAVGLFVFLLMSNIQKIDPKRYPDSDSSIYRKFGLLIMAFLSGISLVILYSTAHEDVPVNKLIFSFLFIGMILIMVLVPIFFSYRMYKKGNR